MIKFRRLFESSDTFHQMPYDHLHAETHGALTSAGYERVSHRVWGVPDTSKAFYTYRVRAALDNMKKIGWKYVPSGGTGMFNRYVHSNGTGLSHNLYNDSWSLHDEGDR